MKLPFTALLLAGGASRRMGRDKALLQIRGRRAIDLAVSHYRPRARAVLVASGSRRIPHLGAIQVADPVKGAGPLAGLAAGMACASTPWVLLLACDQPLLPDLLLVLLWKARRGERVVCLSSGGNPYPIPALYHRSLLPGLRRLLQEGAGPRALLQKARRIPERLWRQGDPHARFKGGWNTPAALRCWRRSAFDPVSEPV